MDVDELPPRPTGAPTESDDGDCGTPGDSVTFSGDVAKNGRDTEASMGSVGGQSTGEGSASHREPLAYCRFIVKRPKLALGLTLAGHVFLLLLTGALIGGGYDILPVDFAGVPLDLTEHDSYLRAEAWTNRDTPTILPKFSGTEPAGEREEVIDTIQLIFEGSNVFSKESLQAMRRLENELTSVPGYDEFCQLTDTGDCVKPQSVLRFFDGTIPAPVFNDPEFDNIGGVLLAAQSDPRLSAQLNYHLGKDFQIDMESNNAQSSATRSVIFFAMPYTATVDSLENLIADKYRTRLYELVDEGYGGMEVLFYSGTLYGSDVTKQVNTDLLLAAGSFMFIFFFVMFQTQSLFISSLALFSVLTSFTGANLIYRIIFDYRYFGIFHVLSVFIILGIGADDIFVFYDTWRATGHESHVSLAHRLSECYRRAALSMLITSLTTMIAFIANALSPLLAIQSFGLFSGILVLVNYLSVIIYFPCVVVVHHLYWANWKWPCFRVCSNTKTSKVTDSKSDLTKSPRKIVRKGPVVRFCIGPYFRLITHRVGRWVILAGFAGLLSTFIYFATTLKPDEEQVRIYKKTHNYELFRSRGSSAFMPSEEDRVIRVYLVWGLGTHNRSMCHKTDFKDCAGEVIWDDSFDLNPKPAQVALLNLCREIQNMTDEENKELHIRRNSVTGLLEVDCFLGAMDTYLKRETAALTGVPDGLPVSETSMARLMAARTDVYNPEDLSPYFYRYFETGLSYWLYGGYFGTVPRDAAKYTELLGQSNDPFDTVNGYINFTEYIYGTRLRYAAFAVNTSLLSGNMGFDTGIPIADAWEQFTHTQMKKLPPSVSNGFQCTPGGQWHWMHVQQVLAQNAVQGIIIGISLAFPVLVLATQNMVVGLLATLTIASITVTVVGLIPVAGWKLGVLESLNLSLVVGLSVDYVVHLAEGYHMSKCSDRKGRVRDMLEHVGVSVISGACTTVGASFFMLFAQILFFMQFAIFMFSTIGFSLLYSLVAFTTILALIGPEREFGSIGPVYQWLRNKCTGRKSTDVDCVSCSGKGFHGRSLQS